MSVKVGSNSGFAAGQLVSLAERIERLEEEKSALAEDIKEVYAEAKGHGFDPAILKKAIRLRNIPAAERQEMEAVLDLYMAALGAGEKQQIADSLAAADDADQE